MKIVTLFIKFTCSFVDAAFHVCYWHPLTGLSHATDYAISGLSCSGTT